MIHYNNQVFVDDHFMVAEDGEHWADGTPMPGSAEPVEGKCAGTLTQRRLRWGRALGFRIPPRYCLENMGKGTSHNGIGRCKMHFGNASQYVRKYEKIKIDIAVEKQREEILKMIENEPDSIAKRLLQAQAVKNPYAALEGVAARVLQTELILTEMQDELQSADYTDKQGVQHVQALLEKLMEAQTNTVTVMEKIVKLDLAERKIQLEEEQAIMLASAFIDAIEDTSLHLDDIQLSRARQLIEVNLAPMVAQISDSKILDAEVVE